jgi:hypothetical protein
MQAVDLAAGNYTLVLSTADYIPNAVNPGAPSYFTIGDGFTDFSGPATGFGSSSSVPYQTCNYAVDTLMRSIIAEAKPKEHPKVRREIWKPRVFRTAVSCLLLLFFAAIVPTRVAFANITPAATFTPANAFNNVEATAIGWEFTVSANIWVSALGYYDYSAGPTFPSDFCCSPFSVTSGLLDNHIVGIFNSAGTLLTSTTVPSGTAGTLVGNSLYAAISTIELTPGTYFVEGTQQGALGANPTDPVAFQFSSLTTIPEISGLVGVASEGGSPGVLTFGNEACCGYEAYIGPNFLASNTAPSATPEPSYILLVAGGLAGLLLWKHRRPSLLKKANAA